MTKFQILSEVYDKMVSASKAAVPNEACGLLAGTGNKITKFYGLTNADASPEHFSMIPEEQFAVIKDMRKSGVQMLAIWHSHPSTPARMSDEDMKLAFTPDTVYVILSLAKPDVPSLRGYQISDNKPVEIELNITK
ncbi:MAG: hypothetical protein A2283_19085 [Lentisphaerae bacterium RIFOXYA12_FULL_48_11]|nr:MAG: hypothetical protein A2283_19085 [Lentisphaerae bacterium RIFOXYA12_FULL_48_11]